MITVDQFMDIKSRNQNGQSIHSIQDAMQLARNTVRKVLRSEHPIETKKKPQRAKIRASKIDEFKEYVRKRVEEFDLSPARILAEIKAMGYSGGIHTLRRFVKSLKQDNVRLSLATVRFETPPGKQAQCDWGHIGKFSDASGKLVDIYVFVMVLGYSRQTFIHFTTSMKIPTFIECHQKAFEYFHGIPQSILYDNMSQVRSGPNRLNTTFADFAGHYGFEIKTHRPYRPRTKGKVERAVDYIKDNFINGRTFVGLADLQTQGLHWLENVANVRIHGTTGRKPHDLWMQEKDQLIDLATARPYSSSVRTERKVAVDSFVSFDRCRYSVPPQFIGKTIEIVSQAGSITIHCEDVIIAEHLEATSPGQTIMNPKHMEELWLSTLNMCPIQGKPHCNVDMSESVEHRSLEQYQEVCS
jgi:transposase